MLRLLKFIHATLIFVVGLPLFLWVAGFIVFCGAVSSMTEPKEPLKLDAAIVLTGGTNRVDHGLDLLSDGIVDYLLVSGVHKDVTFSDLMTLWGYKDHIPQQKVTLGREAGNTIGNAIEARSWTSKNHIGSAYVITSNYHMPRALLEFRHALSESKLVPYPVEPQDFSPLQQIYWRTSFIEYHKLLVSGYRILLYPDETHPIPPSMTK